MANLSPTQRSYVRKKSAPHEPDPSEVQGELNIVPFLDIVVNLIMFLLMSISTVAFFSQVEASLPEYSRGGVGRRSSDEPLLNLNITVTAEGIIVTGSGGKLAPGCATTSSGRVITVPNRGTSYDWNGLTACVARVKQEFLDETKVTVSADPMVEYQHIVSAMDAVRDRNGEELFPDVQLSAGVR